MALAEPERMWNEMNERMRELNEQGKIQPNPLAVLEKQGVQVNLDLEEVLASQGYAVTEAWTDQKTFEPRVVLLGQWAEPYRGSLDYPVAEDISGTVDALKESGFLRPSDRVLIGHTGFNIVGIPKDKVFNNCDRSLDDEVDELRYEAKKMKGKREEYIAGLQAKLELASKYIIRSIMADYDTRIVQFMQPHELFFSGDNLQSKLRNYQIPLSYLVAVTTLGHRNYQKHGKPCDERGVPLEVGV